MLNWIKEIIKRGPTDLSDILKHNPLILDVRGMDEYEAGHVHGAVHIPLHELDQRVDEVRNMNRIVVAYCRSGVRSAKAVNVLKAHGIEAYNGGGHRDLEEQIKAVLN